MGRLSAAGNLGDYLTRDIYFLSSIPEDEHDETNNTVSILWFRNEKTNVEYARIQDQYILHGSCV